MAGNRQLKTSLIGLGLFLFVATKTLAQDSYFSQYTQSAAVYNPAMTGMHDAVLKVSLLYQDHLNFSNSSIRKGVLSAEYGKDISPNNYQVDRLGIGGGFVYDDFGGGAFFNNSFFLNVAYLKSISATNKHKIGLGLQMNYANRTIDYSRLSFGTQFLAGFYDKTINSNEIISTRSADYFDFQAGIMYVLSTDYFNFRTGFSAYHITEPESDDIKNFKIKPSVTYFAASETWFKNGKRLYLDGYYRYKNLELSYGGLLSRYTLVNLEDFYANMISSFFMVGLNINSNLLLSPYIGWKSPSLEAGLSFDLKISNVDYYAYPFESFMEFMIVYKLQPNARSLQNVGGGLF